MNELINLFIRRSTLKSTKNDSVVIRATKLHSADNIPFSIGSLTKNVSTPVVSHQQ